jgi:D-alanine-D-alanine ligase
MGKSKKLNIAVITGGNNAEREISIKSANTIMAHLDKEKYNSYLLNYHFGRFEDAITNLPVDLNKFSMELFDGVVRFDLVILFLHGTPAEDGKIQAYLELMDIPYVGCDHFTSALTFDKQACKMYLSNEGVPMAKSVLLHKENPDLESVKVLEGHSLFVKPNKNGSSYGISKVEAGEDYAKAIEKAFEFDDEVIVEQYIKGREFSNGVYRGSKGLHVMPITEIIPHNDFFDYEAKYKNKSEEVTPAELNEKLTQKCQVQSEKLYKILQCKGMVRFDYILIDDEFYFLEVNTIPGFSEQSLFPQQIRAKGLTISQVLDEIIDHTLKK